MKGCIDYRSSAIIYILPTLECIFDEIMLEWNEWLFGQLLRHAASH